VTSCHCIEII